MNAVVVIQARIDSTRLPKKVFEPLGDRCMVECVRARAEQLGFPVLMAWPGDWDGPEDDVLGRIAHVVRTQAPEADTIIRLTADCPLWEVEVGKAVLQTFKKEKLLYCGTGSEWDGLDTEVFTSGQLWLADRLATEPYDREHVTPWMKRSNYTKVIPSDLTYRWSVDDQEGLDFVRRVYAACALCAQGIPHHANSGTSIGGSDRGPVWDIHAVPDSGGVGLAECTAFDILMSRTGGPVYVSQ